MEGGCGTQIGGCISHKVSKSEREVNEEIETPLPCRTDCGLLHGEGFKVRGPRVSYRTLGTTQRKCTNDPSQEKPVTVRKM